MPIKIQEILINLFLQPIAKITDKFSVKVKDSLYICGIIILTLLQFANSSGIIYLRFLLLFLPFCFSFGLMILSGLSTNIQSVKFNPSLTVCWFGMVLFMTLSSLIVSLDYLAHAVIWGIILPVFFIVWANNDYRKLIKLTVSAVEISFVIFLIINFLFFEFTTSEYRGLFLNPNGNGAYCTIVFICSLFHILNSTHCIKKILFPCFILGSSFTNIIYSSSRGSMVAILGAFMFAIISFIIIHRSEIKKFLLTKLLPIGLSLILIFAVFPSIFNLGYSSLPFLYNNIIIKTINNNIAKYPDAFKSFPRGISEYDRFNHGSPENENFQTNDGVFDRTMEQFNIEGGISGFSTGRIGLWKLYAKELSLLGNPTDKVIKDDSGAVETRESHLTHLQFSYEFGIFTGIFFLVFNIISAIYAFKFFIRKKGKDYSSFPIIIAVGYGIISLIEVMMSPVTRLIIAIYLLSQTHIITNKLNNNDINEEEV